MAAPNAATVAVAQPLAVEHAPLRSNAVSPGLTESGFDQRLDERGHAALFAATAKRDLAGRIGHPQDVVDAGLSAMTHSLLTGAVIEVAGGGCLT